MPGLHRSQSEAPTGEHTGIPIANDPSTWELLPGFEETPTVKGDTILHSTHRERAPAGRLGGRGTRPRSPLATGANAVPREPPQTRQWGARNQENGPAVANQADRASVQTLNFSDKDGRRQTSLTDGRYAFTQTPREARVEPPPSMAPPHSQSSECIYWDDDQ